MSKITCEEPNYNFNKVDFQCDSTLGDHIKEPFPNKSFFMTICGKPGSGKTSLLINMLTASGPNRVYRKVFDKIILVMPKNSRESLKNNPFDDLPGDQLYQNFSTDVVDKIYETKAEFDEEKTEAKANNKQYKQKNQLLILDDVTAYLKDDPRSLIELATNRRHLKLSIILLVQFIKSIPLSIRLQVTNVAFFKPSNELDTKILHEEYMNLSKSNFDELKRVVWKTQHDFIMIDKNNDTYYNNLAKINFNNKQIENNNISDNNIDININAQKVKRKKTKKNKKG